MTKNDIFCFLPVYYAGGSTSFSPTSEEVYLEYCKKGRKKYLYFPSRKDALKKLQSTAKTYDIIVIMGARDNSLSKFAEKFTCQI